MSLSFLFVESETHVNKDELNFLQNYANLLQSIITFLSTGVYTLSFCQKLCRMRHEVQSTANAASSMEEV